MSALEVLLLAFCLMFLVIALLMMDSHLKQKQDDTKGDK